MKTANHFMRRTLIAKPMVFVCQYSQGQILKRLKGRVKQRTEDHMVTDGGNATNRAIDKVGQKSRKSTKGNRPRSYSESFSASFSCNTTSTTKANTSSQSSIITYKNYDFVPGDIVIFQSNLEDEGVAKIPSQFALVEGQLEVHDKGNENIIHLPTGKGAWFTTSMSKENYIPEKFTVEFDFKNEKFGVYNFRVDCCNNFYYTQDPAIIPGIPINLDYGIRH